MDQEAIGVSPRVRTGSGIQLWIMVLILISALTHSVVVHSAGKLYRYVNSQGKIEISSSIPNDRVMQGYEVLDGEGRLILRVAPEMTPAQLREKKKKDAELQACREGYERVIAMYQTEADIDRFEGEALEALQTAIANDQANLLVVRGQHSDLLAQAARAERTSSTMSAILVQNIERASSQIKLLEKSIMVRQAERSQIEKRFREEREILKRGPC